MAAGLQPLYMAGEVVAIWKKGSIYAAWLSRLGGHTLQMQVAEARSDETFVALCLLTVTGASLLTQKLGFSDTMGAFVAGVLLAETNYSTQVQCAYKCCIC